MYSCPSDSFDYRNFIYCKYVHIFDNPDIQLRNPRLVTLLLIIIDKYQRLANGSKGPLKVFAIVSFDVWRRFMWIVP